METSPPRLQQFTTQIQAVLVWIWVTLGRPKTTLVLGFLMLGILLLRWLIPQQMSLSVTAAEWTAILPAMVKPWGQMLFALGFSRITQSVWFWLPVALLLLNSLIALAEFGPAGWQRSTAVASVYSWQHPLAQRVENSMRLPAAPDEFLETLKSTLIASGYQLDALNEDNPRLVSAKHHRWLWLAVPIFYGGVFLLCCSFFISNFAFQTEQVTLQPFKLKQSRLFQAELQKYQGEAYPNQTIVIVDPSDEDQEARALFLHLYRPYWFRQLVIWPTANELVLTVEAKNANGLSYRLFPEQIDLSPDTRLNFSLRNVEQPHYFRIPAEELAFQVLPIPEEGEDSFNIQVRRGSESSPSDNFSVQIGESFMVDDLILTLTLNQSLQFVVFKDPALPLYVISLFLMIGSGLLLVFWPPAQCWLIPEVKGRGGQLYGVLEMLGSKAKASKFLEMLLVAESGEEEAAIVSEADPQS